MGHQIFHNVTNYLSHSKEGRGLCCAKLSRPQGDSQTKISMVDSGHRTRAPQHEIKQFWTARMSSKSRVVMGHEYRAQKFTIVHRFTAHINQQGWHWDSQLLASKSTSAGTATDLGCFRKSFMMGSAQPWLSGQAARLWKIHSHSGTTPILYNRFFAGLRWASMMYILYDDCFCPPTELYEQFILEGRLPFLSPKCPLKS